MNQIFRYFKSINPVYLLMLIVALLIGTGFGFSVVQAQRTQPINSESPAPALAPAAEAITALPRTITVVGEGQLTIKPDMAQTNIGVEIIGDSVKMASAQAAETTVAVLAALKAAGIAEGDIQTSGYNVWVERPYTPEGVPGEKFIYHMGNNFTVTIRDLDKIGAVLDAAIEAGANNIYGVNFNVSDPTDLKAEAREKATADARSKAQTLAGLNQMTLGQVISVSEVIGGNGGYYPGGSNGFFAADGVGGGGGPFVPGELNLNVQLQVTYAIQ